MADARDTPRTAPATDGTTPQQESVTEVHGTSSAADTGEVVRRKAVRRRQHPDGRPFTARERLAAHLDDPWGGLVLTALLCTYAYRVSATPLGIPALIVSLVALAALARTLVRHWRRGKRGTVLVVSLLMGAILAAPFALHAWLRP